VKGGYFKGFQWPVKPTGPIVRTLVPIEKA